ncbi:MAG: HAMP domain-containing protein, partial [Desulfobacterales bacterium]|nr:HAMP domain-containing protein [Desulfobacterales bacterium]
MKSKSVKFRILSLLVLAFLITAACIIFLAERQLTRIVDSGQDEIYAEKLAAILADLDRAHRDLQHTGMVQAYEEEAQAEILGELRKEYYASPSPRIYPLILDEKGAVLMHPGGKEDRGELSGPLENMLKDMGGGVRDYTWRGEKKWMVFAHFKQWRWIVVYTTPLDVKYRDVSRFRNRLALIMGSAGVLVTLVLSLLFSRWILNPIARLKNTCEIISGGDLDREIDVSRGDEIGSLAASFAHLRDEIKKKITHLNAEIQERRRAETERTRLEAITRITVEAVSAGDYSRRLEVKGEKDLLAVSINRMLANLEEANQDARRKIDYLNKIPAPVHVIDVDFNVQFINDAGADLVRRNAEECVGVKCYELFRTSHCNTENCRARVAMERGGKAKGETVAGLLTGDLPVRYTSAPLEDDAGNIMGVIEYLVDITDEMKVVDLAERISRGDYTAEIGIASEEDRLSVSLNRMIETLNRITAVAEAVAAGDYSGSVEARGERDLLGKAIGRMTENLRKVTEESRREDWIKSGQNQLNERMREEQDTAALTRSLLDFLVERLDVQVGACYLAGKDGRLRLVSSHAYQERSNIYNDFRPGEGMIGQAALEKKSILYNRIPGDHDHMTIHYGIGETAPRAIFILPLVFEDQVQGVVALGATSEFTPAKRELLDRVAENAAIALNSARSRARMKELLERTRSQAEELKHRGEELKASNEELEARTNVLKESEEKLRIQGEELRASNEELETQTVILRESEEKLKIQSEELQAANEELEEKTEILEQQKIEVERKNARIEISRREVEEKARDLALASRYKSEFLANMSHELRTPLNSLLLLAKMLSDNETGNLTEKQVEAARVIDAGGRDLLSLINDILDLSKIEAGKMEVDFREEKIDRIIGRLRDQFNPVAGDKGVAFEVEIAPGIPGSLKTDGQRVEQILKNLLSNAFKFTRQGQVRLHIHFPDVGIRFSRVDLDPGAAMAFSVIDTGCGIPEKKQKAIFEAFQQADGTTSRQFGGTGLGLTISRELSRRLGGEIQLRSEPGKGCVFPLFLPGDGPREPTLPPPAPREPPGAPPPLAAPPAPERLPDDRNDIHPGD